MRLQNKVNVKVKFMDKFYKVGIFRVQSYGWRMKFKILNFYVGSSRYEGCGLNFKGLGVRLSVFRVVALGTTSSKFTYNVFLQ